MPQLKMRKMQENNDIKNIINRHVVVIYEHINKYKINKYK